MPFTAKCWAFPKESKKWCLDEPKVKAVVPTLYRMPWSQWECFVTGDVPSAMTFWFLLFALSGISFLLNFSLIKNISKIPKINSKIGECTFCCLFQKWRMHCCPLVLPPPRALMSSKSSYHQIQFSWMKESSGDIWCLCNICFGNCLV